MSLRYSAQCLVLAVFLAATQCVCAQPPVNPPPNLGNRPQPVAFREADPTSWPEGALRHFVTLYNNAEWNQMSKLIAAEAPDKEALATVVAELGKARGTLRLRLTDLEVDPRVGEVRADFTVRANDHLGLGMVWREQLKLISQARPGEPQRWYLVPSAPEAARFDGYLQRLVTLLAYPAELMHVERQREAMTQVRQLTLGLMQFVQDFDEKFALAPEKFKESILPYVRTDTLWTAPGDEPGQQSYSFNPHLANQKIDAFKNPAETVMVYLGKDAKPEFRYGGKTIIGYADGHVRALDAEQAKTLRWEP